MGLVHTVWKFNNLSINIKRFFTVAESQEILESIVILNAAEG